MKEEQNQILYVDACVRGASRTRRLAETVLNKLGGCVERVDLGGGSVICMDGAALEILYGIDDVRYFDAQGLDIDGADVEGILSRAEQRIMAEL